MIEYKKEWEKKSHILKMLNCWSSAMYGISFSNDELEELRQLMKKYPIIRAVYEAGDFSNCVTTAGGRHVWEWDEEDWKVF